ncbi:MAG: hypothetical protein QM744_04140 [Mesorhizobium sp.]
MSAPSIQEALLNARAELIEGAGFSGAFTRKHGIDLAAIAGFGGAYGMMSIADCGGGRFEFAAAEAGEQAFVFEAIGEDGETVVDLVALPVSDPTRSLSMFGRCGLLGLWEAMGPATYFMGGVLDVRRTPLQWLQSGCKGAAIVTPSVAARQLVETPGRLAVENHIHGRELVALLKTVIDINSKVIVRQTARRAA